MRARCAATNAERKREKKKRETCRVANSIAAVYGKRLTLLYNFRVKFTGQLHGSAAAAQTPEDRPPNDACLAVIQLWSRPAIPFIMRLPSCYDYYYISLSLLKRTDATRVRRTRGRHIFPYISPHFFFSHYCYFYFFFFHDYYFHRHNKSRAFDTIAGGCTCYYAAGSQETAKRCARFEIRHCARKYFERIEIQ